MSIERPAFGEPEHLAPGDVLARKYRLVEILGEGGMAVVWVAQNIALETKVAIKVLREGLSRDPRIVQRVQREAKATAAIAHKNIVQVFDYGLTAHGCPYIVMELLRGETFADRLKERGKLRPTESAHILLRAMKGITVAHAKGIFHRDLKPENIFLAVEDNGTERPKVLDFGVASVLLDGQEERTRSGGLVGTPAYIPPEVITEDGRGDARGDVWALGVMLYESITGMLPFQGATTHALLESIVADDPEPMSAFTRSVDPKLEAIVRRALAKNPQQRYPGVRELFDDLNQWLGEQEVGVSVPHLAVTGALPADPHSDFEGPTVVGPSLEGRASSPPDSRPLSSPVPPTASSRPTIPAARAIARSQASPGWMVAATLSVIVAIAAVVVAARPRDRVAPARTEPKVLPEAGPPPVRTPTPIASEVDPLVTLDIVSLPQDALVFVDDERTELPAHVRRGSTVRVRVECTANLPWSQEVAAEGAVRLVYAGQPKPPPPHVPKPPPHPVVGDYKDVPY